MTLNKKIDLPNIYDMIESVLPLFYHSKKRLNETQKKKKNLLFVSRYIHLKTR